MAVTQNNTVTKVPKRILGTLLSSLSAGVVPRSGAPYIAIGRTEEIESLTTSLDRVSDGEGATKFIIGRYGSGKSFLIQLSRGYALDKGFITADCDLSPERKLSGGSNSGLATFRELMKNIACKSSPDGGALPVILGKWFTNIGAELTAEGYDATTEAYNSEFGRRIMKNLRELEADVGGFDFASVLREYYNAWLTDDDMKQSACLKWLRGEYGTRTEARSATGIRSLSVIGDDNWYDYLKLFTAFVRLVGYSGLCVYIDECVNLYKIPNRISRENNYEKILAMFNDTMQGRAPGLMIVFGGTPQFLEDSRRGLYSYEALRSRLADGRFGGGELRSLMQPVIRLRRLSDSELLALVLRLNALHGEYHKWTPSDRITDTDIRDFLTSSLTREGAEKMITPREIIRDFVTLLDLLYTNTDKTFADIAGSVVRSSVASNVDDAEDAPVMPNPANEGNPTPPKPKITLDDIEF
ncbi:MAG: ATP-binding protein [Clostridia bacterium]|nr:ATP-binding protein [Clostridia bacterium]